MALPGDPMSAMLATTGFCAALDRLPPVRPSGLALRSKAMSEPSDEELMLAYARDDARAFERLYLRHRGTLYRFLLRSVSRAELAEELFQETWMRVINARARYRPEARFTTWLLQIAHNLLIDGHRRAAPEETGAAAELALLSAADTAADRPDQAVDRFQEQRRLQVALASLPADQRNAFLLRVEGGLGLDEIAAVTEVGRETAKSRLRYALEKLRESLSQ